MKNINSRFFLFLVPAVIFGAAITPAHAIDLNPLSALKAAVEAAVEDRSSSDIGKDLGIKVEFTASVIKEMGTDAIAINADVYEQEVLLTGSVENHKLREQAEKLTRQDEDIVRVYNEILVVKPLDKNKGAIENFIDDTVIESKINALLLDAKGVNVTNFRWRSVGGKVFLFGRALSKMENSKATAIVKDIKNVISVKNLVKIKPKDG